ncbi:hypothetical protein [Prochlorococcus sp. MIT 1307]|uniref:hypothetical protein n=1 Tax=Prochlorococcus sp. MIT 1307 TaxID=3096219 RepID=UPI002A75C73A|nr:hypothetical protein [Prochlorococcus sp. MIT 1307]
MANVPDKCKKCSAPIYWDKVSQIIECDFCGYVHSLEVKSSSTYQVSTKNRSKTIISNSAEFQKPKQYSNKPSSLQSYSKDRLKICLKNAFGINRKSSLIVSLPISLLALLTLLMGIVILSVFPTGSTPILFVVPILFSILGLFTGIRELVRKNNRRQYAFIGTIISLLIFIVLVI